MNFDEQEALTYGTEHGAGWRLDCLGTCARVPLMPTFRGNAGDLSAANRACRIQDVWQRKPVSLEVCYTVAGWQEKGYDVDYILDQALRWHVEHGEH